MTEQINTEELEVCITCGKTTHYKRSDNIQFRSNYIEGAGQLCSDCNPTRLIVDQEWLCGSVL